MGRGRDAYKWIGGAHAPRGRLALGERLKTIAQEAGVALVNFLEAGDCRRGVGERFGRDALGARTLRMGCMCRPDTQMGTNTTDDSDVLNVQAIELKIETRLNRPGKGVEKSREPGKARAVNRGVRVDQSNGRRLAIILGALHENAFGLIANMLTRSFPCRHIERHRWIAEALDDGLSLTAIVENVKFNWIFRQRAH